MDTGTKWEHYNAGQHARVSSMAGITYFVALPFDVADGSIVVGEPFGCPSPAIQDELNLGSGQCAGTRDMNDTAGEFAKHVLSSEQKNDLAVDQSFASFPRC